MNDTKPPGLEPARPESTSSASAESTVLPPKRIYRDPHGPLGGVAGGFAGYFDIDPVISRLLWIVALFSGIGLPAYLVCWLVIPKAKAWPPAGYHGRPSAGSSGQNNAALLSGFVIVALAGLIGAGAHGVGDYLLPAALVGFGVYLLTQRRPELSAQAREESPASPSDPLGNEAHGDVLAKPREPERARPEPSGLVTPIVLSVLALTTGVIGALGAADVVHVSVAALAAGALVIVGVGLVASLWLGRARGLVPLGLGLSVVMLAASTLGPWLDGSRGVRDRIVAELQNHEEHKNSASAGSGNQTYAPKTLAELASRYELGAGKLTLDLTDLDFAEETREIEVDVGAGKALVLVPDGLSVEVRGEVGIGKMEAFGRSNGGVGVSLHEDQAGLGSGKLIMELNVGIGKGQVRHGS